jgi:hypothetical protein
MRQEFEFQYNRNAPNQLPKLKRLLSKYAALPLPDLGNRISDVHALIVKLRFARSLITTANPDAGSVVSLDLHPSRAGSWKRKTAEAYAQALALGVDVSNTQVMHRNAEILRARAGRLDIMNGELKRIAQKDEDAICESMEELEAARAGIEDGTIDQAPGNRKFFYAINGIWGALMGFTLGRFNGSPTFTVISTVLGTLFGLGVAAGRQWRESARSIIVNGRHIFKDFENEVKELSRGFDARYANFAISIDETMEKSREGLNCLIDELLPQVPEQVRERVQRDIGFFEARDS